MDLGGIMARNFAYILREVRVAYAPPGEGGIGRGGGMYVFKDGEIVVVGRNPPFGGTAKSLSLPKSTLSSVFFFLQQFGRFGSRGGGLLLLSIPIQNLPMYIRPPPPPKKIWISPPFFGVFASGSLGYKSLPQLLREKSSSPRPGRARYGYWGVVRLFFYDWEQCPPIRLFRTLGVGLVICRFYGYGYAVSSRLFEHCFRIKAA